MITFRKLQLVKEMITQQGIYYIILISKRFIALDISTQQALDADSKAIQQIDFTTNIYRDGGVFYY